MRANARGALLLVSGLLLPGLATAASIVFPPVDERAVEGHTVFTVLENPFSTATRVEFAAAVAVLVEEVVLQRTGSRFPGVLWFNDRYLVNPDGPSGGFRSERGPCTGAVLAVNAGDPDPRAPGPGAIATATYVESYFITDVIDQTWNVDKWHSAGGTAIWSVALRNDQAGSNVQDDGVASCPILASTVRYNALLYFYLDDLTAPGAPKDHRAGSTNATEDIGGCHRAEWNRWPCPAGNDHREGNSHPYHPTCGAPGCDPFVEGEGFAGFRNHGTSATCAGAGSFQLHCHATRNIDLYYGVAPVPSARTFRLVDVVGSDAPSHCHNDANNDACGPHEDHVPVLEEHWWIPYP